MSFDFPLTDCLSLFTVDGVGNVLFVFVAFASAIMFLRGALKF